MTATKKKNAAGAAADQIAASAANVFNELRARSRGRELDRQAEVFIEAKNEVENIYGYLRDPSGQLGNPSTKHGEIAEVVEVGIRRAHDHLDRVPMSAHMDDVARTGPVDFILNGVDAQSKFINGTANGLRKVMDHANKNPSFIANGVYVIPKEQYEIIARVLDGDTEGISAKTVRAIEQRIEEIRAATGRDPLEVLKPSISTYADVQAGQIESTMEGHEQDIDDHNDQKNAEIEAAHKASLQEGVQATAAAAAVGATIGFATASFKKYKEGKNIFRGDFDPDDWRDVGGQAAQGAAMGAVTGAAVYLMTNAAGLSAPLAGAFVSAAKGMQPLVASYAAGEISKAELIDAGLFVCCDVAMIGVCAAAGQALIPIPVLGAMIGSLAGKYLSTLLQTRLNDATGAVKARLNDFLKGLDDKQRKFVAKIEARYDALGDLAARAFDIKTNTSLVTLSLSVKMAEAHGVPSHHILRSVAHVDEFMRS